METLLRDATNWQMLNAHLTQYQALYLDKDRLTFDNSLAINPTTLLLADVTLRSPPMTPWKGWTCNLT